MSCDVVAERIEWGWPGTEGHGELFFSSKNMSVMSVCGKNHVSLCENSCRFVGKIMSVCGKNHVSLWDKSFWFVGKICWTQKVT